MHRLLFPQYYPGTYYDIPVVPPLSAHHPWFQGSWQLLTQRNMGHIQFQGDAIPSAPRGPPLKPRQSGHALWVGNLPPFVQITEVKDHFSAGATEDIESVFLISRSNCAFVNYGTEAACRSSMQRFHGSRLDGQVLVCRMRRSPPLVEPKVSPGTRDEASSSQVIIADSAMANPLPQLIVGRDTGEILDDRPKTPEKFFILKSLTTSDLEASVRCGLWTTQEKNEGLLKDALKEADKVHLIFSANKSGEYFGYAQLVSVSESSSERSPGGENSVASDSLQRIVTPPTSTAPQGVIVDDLFRGVIFWEAVESENAFQSRGSNDARFGKTQFVVTWQSTSRVPFWATRGLRNTLNGNREVKIARDGQEVNPRTGRALLNLFRFPERWQHLRLGQTLSVQSWRWHDQP